MIYMVEHGFSADPQHEAEWNTWYSEHATYSFRKVPGWRTGQRFISITAAEPKYRAMYTLEREDVLSSPEYKATTGGRFPEEWRAMITGFHRNLADGDWMPAVGRDQLLVVVDPPASAADVPDVELRHWNIVGLEQSVPRRSIAVVDRAKGEQIAARACPGVGVYAPVFDRWMI
ncbi:MAG TPA: hypothetical protein VLK85_29040 [Ramlibacter sp.]|nr:hypothetical protein [Ramlibacter sp.]